MSFLVLMKVAIPWCGAVRPRRNHHLEATRCQQRYEVIRVVSLVRNRGLHRLLGYQPCRLADISGVATGEDELQWVAQGIGHGMDLSAEAAARAPQGFGIRVAFLAPAAQACARTTVLSKSTACKSGSVATCRCKSAHTPCLLQREKRLNTLFQRPNSAGSKRHWAPLRNTQSTASRN